MFTAERVEVVNRELFITFRDDAPIDGEKLYLIDSSNTRRYAGIVREIPIPTTHFLPEVTQGEPQVKNKCRRMEGLHVKEIQAVKDQCAVMTAPQFTISIPSSHFLPKVTQVKEKQETLYKFTIEQLAQELDGLKLASPITDQINLGNGFVVPVKRVLDDRTYLLPIAKLSDIINYCEKDREQTLQDDIARSHQFMFFGTQDEHGFSAERYLQRCENVKVVSRFKFEQDKEELRRRFAKKEATDRPTVIPSDGTA